jgi:sugar/nucleoside kinase (ribokinase family)
LVDSGKRLGGTVLFSGLTAHALGFKTGIITSHAQDLDLTPINRLWIKSKVGKNTTTFRNLSDGVVRRQYLYQLASPITCEDIPDFKPAPLIVHLGPVANEIHPNILLHFSDSLKCLTPQGWFRSRDESNRVIYKDWEDYQKFLPLADIAIISLDDVKNDEETISKMATLVPIFVVTENRRGARVYWHNDARFITAPGVKYVDDTGAGDIFSTAFFYRYFSTKDPWEAGRFAVQIASWSVCQEYLQSIPSKEIIERSKMELL